MPELNILWLYPDMLNLHGDRGNLPALAHVGAMLGLKVNISRLSSPDSPPELAAAQLLFLPAGELTHLPRIIAALARHRAELDSFLARGGVLLASGSSGAVLSRQLEFCDGRVEQGLGLLPMICRQRERVYGDDLWFRLPDGQELIGCQIQVMDTLLDSEESRLGQVIYGHGNDRSGSEGARCGNVMFTNCLGPLLVKNPRFAARLLALAAAAQGHNIAPQLPEDAVSWEDASFALIRAFIEKKMSATPV